MRSAMSTPSVLYTALIELDLLIFLVAGLSTGFVSVILGRHQTIRPFFPQDATLHFIYTTDTIHTLQVFFVHYVLVAPLIYFLESRLLATHPLPPRRKTIRAARLSLGLLTSSMLGILLVEAGKGYVGRLRPSFATRCLPSTPLSALAAHAPIVSDTGCEDPSRRDLHDARRSFPSGHAALGVGGAAYAQLYVVYAAKRVRDPAWRMALYSAGYAIMGFGAWVAASRVADNAHHVGDVAVGSVIGLWAAAVHFWYVVGGIEAEDQEMDPGEEERIPKEGKEE